MKEAEDDGEIVIKNILFHLTTGERCKLRATSTPRSWKPQEQLVDVPVPHTMGPSPRTMEASVEVVEIFPQERVRADLRTQIP